MLSGNTPFNSESVKNVLRQWRILINNGYYGTREEVRDFDMFPDGNNELFGGTAAMMFMGDFIRSVAPSPAIFDDLDFFQL